VFQQARHHFSNLHDISAELIVRRFRQVSQVSAKEKQVLEFGSYGSCFVKAGGEFSIPVATAALRNTSRD